MMGGSSLMLAPVLFLTADALDLKAAAERPLHNWLLTGCVAEPPARSPDLT